MDFSNVPHFGVMPGGLCPYCQHLQLKPIQPNLYGCKAFPEGILDEIAAAWFDHRNAYPGDNGVRFELKEGEQIPDWTEDDLKRSQANNRQYTYVGSQAIRQLVQPSSQRICVHKSEDILRWIKDTQQSLQSDRTVTATFIIDIDEQLWINDRHSEHIVCANGEDVLSAGEITFAVDNAQVEVAEVTNQSTGYCPESESWWAVVCALEKIGLSHPPDFTTAFVFRRCDACGTTNIVKDLWFECAVCQSPLSEHWNYD
jgi:hypothetical protein